MERMYFRCREGNRERNTQRAASAGVGKRRWAMGTTRYGKGIVSVFLVFLIGAWAASPAAGGHHESKGGLLDGKTFMVQQGEKGKEAKGSDTLVFKGGKFRSLGCDQYGFGDGPYTATAEGDTIKFAADTTSEKKGKMHWEGTVQGDRIEVSYVWIDKSHWYKPNPKPLEKWAKGELRKSE
jgi:hypothetical protein